MSYKASFDNIITTNKMIPIFNYLVEKLNEDVVSIIINKWFIKDHEYKFRSCLTSINNIKHTNLSPALRGPVRQKGLILKIKKTNIS